MEEAKRAGVSFYEFFPERQQWEGGYRERNLKIAKESDVLLCVTVKTMPDGRLKFCPHCNTTEHVGSGGCWTMKKAEERGKRVELYVVGG